MGHQGPERRGTVLRPRLGTALRASIRALHGDGRRTPNAPTVLAAVPSHNSQEADAVQPLHGAGGPDAQRHPEKLPSQRPQGVSIEGLVGLLGRGPRRLPLFAVCSAARTVCGPLQVGELMHGCQHQLVGSDHRPISISWMRSAHDTSTR